MLLTEARMSDRSGSAVMSPVLPSADTPVADKGYSFRWGAKPKNPGRYRGLRLETDSFSTRFPSRDFRLVGAVIDNGAGRTIGFPRLANIAAMQNQPMMSMEPEFPRHPLFKFQFHIQRGFAGREARPIGNAENMGIHGHGRLTKKDVQNHIGGFSAHAGQGL